MTDQNFLTREEAADILGVSTRTLDRFSRKKILKSHRRGRRSYFLKSDIDQLTHVEPAPQVISASSEAGQALEPLEPESSSLSPLVNHNLSQELSALTTLIQDLHGEVVQKDAQIAALNYELGVAREKEANSVPLLQSQNEVEALKQDFQSLQVESASHKASSSVYKRLSIVLGALLCAGVLGVLGFGLFFAS